MFNIWTLPSGAQRCLDPVWPTAGRAQCVDQMYPGQIWSSTCGQKELIWLFSQMQLMLKPNYRSMILRTLFRKPSACSTFRPQSFHFSATICQLLLKKPQGQVKLTNNLFKADAIKKVILCNFCEAYLSLLFPSSWRKMGLLQTSV